MSGLDEGRIRITYQLVLPDQVKRLQILSDDPSPSVVIGRLLNELGEEGWELVTYDTTANRGVFKRSRA
jgi:hypothetical protein